MKPAGTVHASDWKDGFLFVGNHPALDFLNTRPVQDDEPMELLPDFSSLLRWFQAAELLSARDADHLEQEWGKSALFRTAQSRGLVCTAGAQRSDVVRQRGSEPRPQVRSVRTALP